MARDDKIIDWMKAEQMRAFRIAQDPRRYGLALKTIAIDSEIEYKTLLTYANGSAVMPITAYHKLVGVLPTELLSMLLPAGHVIVKAPEEIDHDAISEAIQDYLHAKERAHHPESEDGREIGPGEDAVLRAKAAVLRVVA